MLKKLLTAGNSAWYWLTLLVLGLAMESVALIYQYALDYGPCVVCIHVRIWVLGIILVALPALLLRRIHFLHRVAHLLAPIMMAGLLERSWLLLGIERGTVEGSCSFDSGLPPWFALDQWFPAIFKVQEACGYTPELVFGITMAEALVVLAAGLLLVTVTLAGVTLFGNKQAISRR